MKGTVLQVYSSFAAGFGGLVTGTLMGYPASAVPMLQSGNATNGELVISKEEAALFSGLLPIGQLIGFLTILTPLFNRLGRQRTLLFVAPLGLAIGWAIIAASQNIYMLDAGRLFGSIFAAIAFGGPPMYVAEISDVKYRGLFISMNMAMTTAGILVFYILGAFLDWRSLAGCGVIMCVPYALLIAFAPETPTWLVANGKPEVALKVLMKLRNSDENGVMEELNKLKDNAKMKLEVHNKENELSNIFKKPVLKAFGASSILAVAKQLCGYYVVIFNCVQIFKDSGSNIDAHMSSIILGVVQLIATAASAVMVDKFGRKLLLSLSSLGMTLSLGILGGFFYFKSTSADVSQFGWIPLVSLLGFIITYSIGFGPLPWVVTAEILPANVRVTLNPICLMLSTVAFFIAVYTYNNIVDAFESYGCFWLYATVAAVSIIPVIFCIPETKGKSFEEIQKFYNPKKGKIEANETPLIIKSDVPNDVK